ncbi:hypothetical protein V8E54_007456 [Elaphomyces granulatus]
MQSPPALGSNDKNQKKQKQQKQQDGAAGKRRHRHARVGDKEIPHSNARGPRREDLERNHVGPAGAGSGMTKRPAKKNWWRPKVCTSILDSDLNVTSLWLIVSQRSTSITTEPQAENASRTAACQNGSGPACRSESNSARPESYNISHTITQAPPGEQQSIGQGPVILIAHDQDTQGASTSTRDIDWMKDVFLTGLAKPIVRLPLANPSGRIETSRTRVREQNAAETALNRHTQITPSAGSEIKNVKVNVAVDPVVSPKDRDPGNAAICVQQMFINAIRSPRGSADIQPQERSGKEKSPRTKQDQRPVDGRDLEKFSSPSQAISPTPPKPASLKNAIGVKQVLSTKSTAKRSLFLDLPGELRTKIYEIVYETYRVEIIRAKPKTATQRPGRYRLFHRSLPPRNPTTHVAPGARRNRAPPSPPLGLTLSCKRILYETLLYLYTNTQFVFSSPKTIRAFLNRTPEIAQRAIRHLELHHVMYNEPQFTKFREFKLRSDMSWYLACHAMAQSFTSLRVLHLNLAVFDWPIRLELGERWALPPLRFSRCGGLEYADIKLSMRMFKEEKLKQTARLLEQAIMKPEAYQVKEDERIAKELAGPVKVMVLDLTV